MKRNDFIRKMQQRLIIRRDALRHALAGEVNSLRRARDAGYGDEADFSLATAQDELGSQMAEVESRELRQIERALETMRTGHYGKCEQCGQAISVARLQAVPNATQCIACARREERRSEGSFAPGGWQRFSPNREPADEMSFDDTPIDIN